MLAVLLCKVLVLRGLSGTPGWIRTSDRLLRRQNPGFGKVMKLPAIIGKNTLKIRVL